MKRLRTFRSPLWPHWSPNLLSKHTVVVPDSSEVIDGDTGRRFSTFFCRKIGVSRRSRFGAAWSFAGSSSRLRLLAEETLLWDLEFVRPQAGFGCRILQMSEHATSEVSSAAAAGEVRPMSPGRGLSVPPRSTVSTAAWQTCQFPVQRRPTAPLTGLTVLPQASNSRDWNRAA